MTHNCQICPFCTGIEPVPQPNNTTYMHPVCGVMPMGMQGTFLADKVHNQCPIYEYRHIVSFVTVLGRNSPHLPYLSRFN